MSLLQVQLLCTCTLLYRNRATESFCSPLIILTVYQSTFLAWPTQPVRSWSVDSITPTMARLMHVPMLLLPISILSTFLIANQTMSWLLVPVFVPSVFWVFLKESFNWSVKISSWKSSEMVTLMLVSDVGDKICWWRWQHYPLIVTNIMMSLK